MYFVQLPAPYKEFKVNTYMIDQLNELRLLHTTYICNPFPYKQFIIFSILLILILFRNSLIMPIVQMTKYDMEHNVKMLHHRLVFVMCVLATNAINNYSHEKMEYMLFPNPSFSFAHQNV